MKKLCILLLAMLALPLAHAADAPKKLLVVTTTTGFRHGASIPELEKMLSELAQSSGEFTVEFVQQPPGHAANGFPAKLKKDATPGEQKSFADAEVAWTNSLKAVLQKLSPESLKNFDGVVFASTTGDLPLPDPDGFLNWIKAGHAFIGLHAAGDTFHGWPGYIDMIGCEFKQHGAQVGVDCLNVDPANQAVSFLPKTWSIQQEEIYQFTNYNAASVHELLVLDKHPNSKEPGHYPVAWCKFYGKRKLAAPLHGAELLVQKTWATKAGRIFYTSLGHREDIINADPNLPKRINSVKTAKLYQRHVLGGIEWALGCKPKDAHPGPQN